MNDLPTLEALLASDPHARALIESAREVDHARINRSVQRAMLGCCPCGLAPGEAYCPICEGVLGSLGRHLREDGKTLAEITEAERVIVRAAEDYKAAGIEFPDEHGVVRPPTAGELAAGALAILLRTETDAGRESREERRRQGALRLKQALAALVPKAKPASATSTRLPNRHERRRARSRRWRG